MGTLRENKQYYELCEATDSVRLLWEMLRRKRDLADLSVFDSKSNANVGVIAMLDNINNLFKHKFER
jgi:hypothetical protein